MAAELDLSYLKEVVTEVLHRTFSVNSPKRILRVKEKGIEMACPFCGDSQKNPNAKRGMLFFGTLLYACRNEGCRSSLTGLCRDHHIQLDPEKKMEMFKYLDRQAELGVFRQRTQDEYVVNSLDKLITTDELQDYFDNDDAPFLERFRPVTKRDPAYHYMVDRGIPEDVVLKEMYTAKLPITTRWKEDVVVFLNRADNGKILGMQVRNFKQGDDRRFKIYNFEHLYNALHPDAHLDEVEAVSYNKLSYLFNILRVDMDAPVTVFEGYLDALFYPNAVGAVGTETDFGFLTSEGVDVRFFFDNDGAGRWKSRQYMQKGFKVFLWAKFVESRVRQSRDQRAAAAFMATIKDMNALAKATPGNDPVRSLHLERFYSSTDGLDIHWVPAPTKAERDAFKNRKKNRGITESSSLDELQAALQSMNI